MTWQQIVLQSHTRPNKSQLVPLLSVLLLPGPQLPQVELELLSLKDVTISPARLPWSAGDGSVETTGGELGVEERVDLGILFALIEVALSVVGELLLLDRGSGLSGGGGSDLHGLLGYGLRVVRLVPLTEGSSIDLDDRTLYKCVCPYKLVVRRIVHDTDNPGLAGDMLRCPRKVATLQTESPVLGVSTTSTDRVNPLGTKFGVGGLTAEFELSLFTVVRSLRPRGTLFVP